MYFRRHHTAKTRFPGSRPGETEHFYAVSCYRQLASLILSVSVITVCVVILAPRSARFVLAQGHSPRHFLGISRHFAASRPPGFAASPRYCPVLPARAHSPHLAPSWHCPGVVPALCWPVLVLCRRGVSAALALSCPVRGHSRPLGAVLAMPRGQRAPGVF